MRISCLECVRKHLGEAEVLMEESFSGYPHHAMWAVGSFSQATSEALRVYPELANQIREARLAFERCHYRVLAGETLETINPDMPDMEALAEKVHEMILVELFEENENTIGRRSMVEALNLNPRKENEDA